MVYKLVAREAPDGSWVSVAKASADKTSKGGRKAAFRVLDAGTATQELVAISDGFERIASPDAFPDARALQVRLVADGDADPAFEGVDGVRAARAHHARVREELPVRALALSRADPAIPTVYVDAP
jgi:nicotinate phosphoribosyltransferase